MKKLSAAIRLAGTTARIAVASYVYLPSAYMRMAAIMILGGEVDFDEPYQKAVSPHLIEATKSMSIILEGHVDEDLVKSVDGVVKVGELNEKAYRLHHAN